MKGFITSDKIKNNVAGLKKQGESFLNAIYELDHKKINSWAEFPVEKQSITSDTAIKNGILAIWYCCVQ